ncbi:hypothetical protein DFQ04_2539 [Algoriphagus boseongensis]|uniref:Uncharacterized protein n=1 Tax=Algoriphagus boseongensis TaxID=1442587 RepID=A0A4R6T708_9BACT|nr:hypothetical protein [Algoriphagus boseongensis]TDQ16421.1 hypothetical protein DFQ04_2539 [Algoriphagus boseongensis]
MNPEQKLFWIKVGHTIIWAFLVGVIFYVLYSGISNQVTLFTWIGIAMIIAEGLTLAIFKMHCPLTVWARKYSDSTRENFDIFLPEWLAKYNKLIFTTIFLIGFLLVLYRILN